ncbi:hypothetical protein Tco_0913564 [Tanacetum coccineum]
MPGKTRKKITRASGEGGSSIRVSRVVGQLGVGGTFRNIGEAGSVTVGDVGEACGMQKRQTKKRKISERILLKKLAKQSHDQGSTPDTALDVDHA